MFAIVWFQAAGPVESSANSFRYVTTPATTMVIRAFIAIPISEQLRENVYKLQQALYPINNEIKWVHPQNVHITLKFIGNIQESDIERIYLQLSHIAQMHKKFLVTVCGIDAFPTLSAPRVIWGRITDGHDQILQLMQLFHRELTNLGFKFHQNKEIPHLTLGRVKILRNRNNLLKLIEKFRSYEVGSFYPTTIQLIRSRLTPDGPIYSVLKESNFSNF